LDTFVNHLDTKRISPFGATRVSSRLTGGDSLADSVNFGDWLKKRREGRCMTLDEVAKAANFKRSYINKYERNTSLIPPLDTMRKIAEALETTIVEPLMAIGYIEINDVEFQSLPIFIHYRKLSKDGQKLAAEILSLLVSRMGDGPSGPNASSSGSSSLPPTKGQLVRTYKSPTHRSGKGKRTHKDTVEETKSSK
jgi:transcriptional regulator with XRE-family HTH domain